MSAERPPRTRLKPEERARQILAAAARLIVEQGTLPIPFDALGQRVGISKALVYSYFPTQYDLANRLLDERLMGLIAAGLDEAARRPDWREAARACAALYLDETATQGPLLHILLSDLYLAGRIEPRLMAAYAGMMRRMARRLREVTGLGSREAVAALHVLAAIPEETGNLVFQERLSPELGREICLEMVVGGVEGLQAQASPPQGRSGEPELHP